MEQYAENCRFILSANYSSKIIEPIQSRCAIFRFKPLEKGNIKEIIENIAKKEKLKIDGKAIEALNGIGEGDVRRVTNVLQSCASVSNNISEDLIYEIRLWHQYDDKIILNEIKQKKVKYIVTSFWYVFDSDISRFIAKQKEIFKNSYFKIFEIVNSK